MKNTDFGATIVIYNFVVGVLIMLASEKVAAFAGYANRSHSERITRLTQVSTFTFGACVACLSATIYLLFHILRIGL